MANISFEVNDRIDLDELVGLAKTYYDSGDIIDVKYLRWQYTKNPHGKPIMVVAREVENNELIGQYIVIPQQYIIDGETYKGTLSLNTLTRADFRGRGIFTKMALQTYDECARKGQNFTIGFPNQQSYPGFIKKLDFITPGTIPLLIKVLKPLKVALNKLKNAQAKHGDDIEIKFNTYNGIKTELTIRELNFDEDKEKYDEFWGEYRKQSRVQINKSLDYLKWRYIEIPTRTYKLISLIKNSKIIGVAVIRGENTLGSKTALLMDLMLIENQEKDNNAFLSYLINTIKNNQIELIASLLLSQTHEYKLLRKHYFFKVPEKILPQTIHYIVRINKEFSKMQSVKELNNWHICFGDYDVF